MRRQAAALFLLLPVMGQAAVQRQAPPAVAPVEPVKPEERCSVEGSVFSLATGEPLRKAAATLRRNQTGPEDTSAAYTASSDATGPYVITDVEPGRYTLLVEKAGFVSQRYGAKGQMQAGALLTLEKSQKLKDIDFKLIAHGVITGRVLDEDGDPMGNVMLQALRAAYYRGRKQLMPAQGVNSNDLGEFRIAGLPPGRYYLSAVYRPGGFMETPQSSSSDAYAPTYYPSAVSPEAAAPIEITAGAQLRGIDVRLLKTRTVRLRGRVIVPDGKPARNTSVMVMPKGDQIFAAMYGPRTMSRPYNAQGDFIVSSVPPGSYVLIAALTEDGRSLSARVPIDVGNSPVEGLTLQLAPGAELRGSVKFEGSAPERSASRISLRARGMGGMMFGPGPQGGSVKEDNTFVLTNVQADHYDVNAFSIAGGYLKSVRLGDQDITDTGLDLTSGVPAGELGILISMSPGQVEGSVQNEKLEPAAGAVVVLIPEGKRRGLERYYTQSTTDQYGRFSIKSAIPGDYRVYAFDSMEFGAYLDPEWLKPFEEKGEKVSIREGGRETVQLKLIVTDAK